MIKNKSIIENMSEAQKIMLLSDISVAESGELAYLGIPKIKIGDPKDYLGDIYPSDSALLNAWDKEIWREVADAIASSAERDGVSRAVTPGPKLRLTPYRKDLSEDACIAVEYSKIYANAIKEKGVPALLSSFYITESDLAYLDKEPSSRIIREYITEPFSDVIHNSDAVGVLSDSRELSGKYSNINEKLRSGYYSSQKLFTDKENLFI